MGTPPDAPLAQEIGTPLSYVDRLRLAAIVAVVCVHVSSIVLQDYHGLTARWFPFSVLSSFTRWCVPIFVMVSGALLLGRDRAPADFYKRRAARIGIPLVVWSAFYLVFSRVTLPGFGPRAALDNLLAGTPYYHLHFLFIIAGLYLVTPLIQAGIRQATPRQVLLAAALLLLLASANTVVSAELHRGSPTAISLFVPFLGYYLAGYALSRFDLSWAGVRWAPVCALAAAVGTTALLVLSFHRFADARRTLPLNYLSPLVVVMSVAVFAWARSRFNGALSSRWTPLSEATFGVYLVHPALLYLWLRVIPAPDSATTAPLWAAAAVISVLLASLLVTMAALRVPVLRRAFG